MAGTLTISTLSDGTNSTSSTNCIQGSAKAWVLYNGTAGTVTRSYNVSSVTRSSTGIYVINFTTAMPNANYSSNATAGTTGTTGAIAMCPYQSTPTTTTLNVTIFNTAFSAVIDIDRISVSVFSS